MDQFSSWEGKSPSDSQEIPRVFGMRKFISEKHKRPPRIPILSLFNPIQTIPSQFLIDHFNMILPYTPRSSRSPHSNTLHAPLLSPICDICPPFRSLIVSSGLHLVRNIDHKYPRYLKYKSDKFEIQTVDHRKHFISFIKSNQLILRWEILSCKVCT